ncbi:alpha/beta hydrolase family esterase [Kribbella speibonae]|uniref:Poly(3-hydroxybutyrate) depolymerase n=1 Tax=Kribbella speibonae TaxID=1572660 RepID=A0A4R0ID04_9ACTN|nr:PHB depolymerase family esterase [Kribbella speibonae]TCC30279.1 hypothetical protein E0H92_40680 [Kribbella speibonae]
MTFRPVVSVIALLAAVLSSPVPRAEAAGLEEVTGFGSNPGNLRMFRYVPPGLGAGRPVVVALHGCTQSAAAYDDEPGWVAMAQRAGFALVLPQQLSANNASACFNWFEAGDTARGGGEALSIKQMVDRTDTVAYRNLNESMEQWTDVNSADQVADATETVNGATHKTYADATGTTVVETWSIPGMGHGQPIDPDQCGVPAPYILDVNLCAADRITRFWGL